MSLHKQSISKHFEDRQLDKICNENPEIRELERKLKNASHYNELKVQIAEKEADKMSALMRDAELDESVKLRRQLAAEILNEKQESRRRELSHYQLQLEDQIKYEEMCRENDKFRIGEKEIVDQVVKRLRDEQEKDIRNLKNHRDMSKRQVEEDLRERESQRRKMSEQILLDEKKRLEEAERLLTLQNMRQETVTKQTMLKTQITDILANRIANERNEALEIENLKSELAMAQLWEEEKMRDEKLREDARTKKIGLRREQEENIALKERIRQQEKEDERLFAEQMMRQLSDEARLEQLSNEKRRMKQLEHKRTVEQMLVQRAQQRDEEKKKEKSTDCDSALIPLLCVHG